MVEVNGPLYIAAAAPRCCSTMQRSNQFTEPSEASVLLMVVGGGREEGKEGRKESVVEVGRSLNVPCTEVREYDTACLGGVACGCFVERLGNKRAVFLAPSAACFEVELFFSWGV